MQQDLKATLQENLKFILEEERRRRQSQVQEPVMEEPVIHKRLYHGFVIHEVEIEEPVSSVVGQSVVIEEPLVKVRLVKVKILGASADTDEADCLDITVKCLRDINEAACLRWNIPTGGCRLTHRGNTPVSTRLMREGDDVLVHATDAEINEAACLRQQRGGVLYMIDEAFDTGYVNDPFVTQVFGRPARLIESSWDDEAGHVSVGPEVCEAVRQNWKKKGDLMGWPYPVGRVRYKIASDRQGHPVLVNLVCNEWF